MLKEERILLLKVVRLSGFLGDEHFIDGESHRGHRQKVARG